MLEGIFAPIPTPFINEEVAYNKLAENISKWNETETCGYVVFGSNGESAFLTLDEKVQVIKIVKDSAIPEKKIIAGTGSDSIKETIYLTNESAKIGADAALILTPSFYKARMNHTAFINYFSTVADNSEIPIIIYNVPKFTGVEIDPNTVAKLSEHKNIIGIKHSSENLGQFSEFIHKTGDDFYNIVGTASILYAGLCLGGCGGILALANIAPDKCVKIQRNINEGYLKEALHLQMQLLDANKAVTTKYGIAGLKASLDLLGYYGGIPRSPLSPLNKIELEDLTNILEKAQILKIDQFK